MPRKNRRRRSAQRALPADGAAFYGTQRRGTYLWRHIGASRATKYYLCPWCNQDIPPGIAHVVAWDELRPDDRRHWHRRCWERHG
ncbi:hypothetical protein C3B44_06775 [Corynebacterium yudongzhengii]|uniref:ATP/GTP-binding protein n=1 Tax=Corynebacterium yudongzhengii TaxID=2080740 RepID=A0A2U1T9D4_9CORY|nr:hypothetical protein [Corynebacterium yudongzhengii]AWB82095.1 hypothetical protein C3B44_06775 [Corynebacterium yudongzhengii]PWC02599.1 hypothetical protein DF222_01245 [Corynebacterium yudongzhengii]